MREIKFRSYDKTYKRFYYFKLEKSVSGSTINPNEPIGDRTEWMQFTGLIDKNGKDIYCGDIIAIYFKEDGKETSEVFKQEEVKWGVENIGCNGGEYDFKVFGHYVNDEYLYGEMIDSNVTVIGNVFENPELLKIC